MLLEHFILGKSFRPESIKLAKSSRESGNSISQPCNGGGEAAVRTLRTNEHQNRGNRSLKAVQ
ncbi:MAG: hypothetical protein CL912_30655 [Deltaproteobacteria bacterium]|nr:hypothetical protein [Deltaproteobacteria bacterium]